MACVCVCRTWIWIHTLHIVALFLLQFCCPSLLDDPISTICILSLSSMLHVLFHMPDTARLTSNAFMFRVTNYDISIRAICTLPHNFKEIDQRKWRKKYAENKMKTEKPFNRKKTKDRMKWKIVLRTEPMCSVYSIIVIGGGGGSGGYSRFGTGFGYW